LEELLPKDNENIRLPLLGPIEPSEPQGFAPDQMIRCEECLRANPPTRINCLYCSVPLPLTETSARLRKPVLRPPEKHQLGYNTILLPDDAVSDEAIGEAAPLLKLKQEDLGRIVNEKVALPLARTASREEADLIFERLSDLGFRVVNLSDDDLGTTIKRVKSISFDEDELIFNPGAKDECQCLWSEIVLIVPARLVTKRVEIKEVKSRRAENEILDASEFFSDEVVIDLYASTSSATWRVSANGFDFSCLGAEKSLLANENMAKLDRLIRAKARTAQVNDSYARLRSMLDLVWGAQQETKSSGWKRERPGKLSIGMSTINSNEDQFTRYSRLLRYLTAQESN
jgi:hypothetical protein